MSQHDFLSNMQAFYLEKVKEPTSNNGKARKRLISPELATLVIRELLGLGNAGNPACTGGIKARVKHAYNILANPLRPDPQSYGY